MAAVTTIGVVAAAILFQTTARGPHSVTTGREFAHAPVSVSAAALLAQTPDLYVNCPIADSIACDRVHLSINLRRRAASVTATIAGWALPLDYRGDQPVAGTRRRTEFDGLLQPAGIIDHLHVVPEGGANGPEYWYGDSGRPLIPITLFIDYGRGNSVTTRTEVTLSAAGG